MRTLDQQMGSMSFGYRFKKIEYDNLKMIPKSFYISRKHDNDTRKF